MSLTTNAGFDAAVASPALGVFYLVELDFSGGTQYLTTLPVSVAVGANTYTGLGDLGSIGQIKESEDGATQSVDFELSQVKVANLALALGNVNVYQDRGARVYLAVADTNLATAGSPVMRFAGYMDTVSVKRDGDKGKVILRCTSTGGDVRRNPAGLRFNDAQHQARHPGERFFEYTADLIGKPKRWLSVRFQASLT